MILCMTSAYIMASLNIFAIIANSIMITYGIICSVARHYTITLIYQYSIALSIYYNAFLFSSISKCV